MQIRQIELTTTADNHGDVLAALGLASLLRPLGESEIQETTTGFRVVFQTPLTRDSCALIARDAGYLYLRAKDESDVPASIPPSLVFDYSKEKARNDQYRKIRQEARKAGVDANEATAGIQPHPDLDLYSALMPSALKGIDSTNGVAVAIAQLKQDEWCELVVSWLQSLAEGKQPKVPWRVNLVQMFSPHAAKGYARLKPDSTVRGDKTKDTWANPLLEWLRYRGYFAGALLYRVGADRKDIRMLVPVPRRLASTNCELVVKELRTGLPIWKTASKTDCLAVLKLARLLIEQSDKITAPGDLVSGVMLAHYQSMGQSKAISSLERLSLPDWFAIRSEADADLWLEALDEHFNVIRSLNEQFSDELGLIRQYRRYLETRGASAVKELLVFMASYGILVLRERTKTPPRKLKQFRTDLLEEIMKSTSYADILANPGFRAVALALRRATVSAQSMKRNGKNHREIRYDILPELHRKRQLPGKAPFLEAVTEFIASYNAESAKRLEAKKDTGTGRVGEDDLFSFVDLVDAQKDASLLGALLCAYATCKQPKDPEEGGEASDGGANADAEDTETVEPQEESKDE
jgi:hypothetical protein